MIEWCELSKHPFSIINYLYIVLLLITAFQNWVSVFILNACYYLVHVNSHLINFADPMRRLKHKTFFYRFVK